MTGMRTYIAHSQVDFHNPHWNSIVFWLLNGWLDVMWEPSWRVGSLANVTRWLGAQKKMNDSESAKFGVKQMSKWLMNHFESDRLANIEGKKSNLLPNSLMWTGRNVCITYYYYYYYYCPRRLTLTHTQHSDWRYHVLLKQIIIAIANSVLVDVSAERAPCSRTRGYFHLEIVSV